VYRQARYPWDANWAGIATNGSTIRAWLRRRQWDVLGEAPANAVCGEKCENYGQ